MTDFTLHTLESAPDASKPLLEDSARIYGMIPKLHAVLAESPEALEAYKQLHNHVLNSSLTAEEKTVVWQTINVEHGCHYCVPAHSMIANMMNVDSGIVQALRDRTPLPTEKLEVLRDTTLAILKDRGVIDGSALERFYAVGYGKQQLLEILMTLSQKVISNYINHIADTPLDEAFKPFA
ncbi:MAG: carboxymuconolactone decarboxylase [Oceanospirillaceae bacterium]|nr:carboxymuconolactone decarboxylase [Oceanospirillaceae bacterium]